MVVVDDEDEEEVEDEVEDVDVVDEVVLEVVVDELVVEDEVVLDEVVLVEVELDVVVIGSFPALMSSKKNVPLNAPCASARNVFIPVELFASPTVELHAPLSTLAFARFVPVL